MKSERGFVEEKKKISDEKKKGKKMRTKMKIKANCEKFLTFICEEGRIGMFIIEMMMGMIEYKTYGVWCLL